MLDGMSCDFHQARVTGRIRCFEKPLVISVWVSEWPISLLVHLKSFWHRCWRLAIAWFCYIRFWLSTECWVLSTILKKMFCRMLSFARGSAENVLPFCRAAWRGGFCESGRAALVLCDWHPPTHPGFANQPCCLLLFSNKQTNKQTNQPSLVLPTLPAA